MKRLVFISLCIILFITSSVYANDVEALKIVGTVSRSNLTSAKEDKLYWYQSGGKWCVFQHDMSNADWSAEVSSGAWVDEVEWLENAFVFDSGAVYYIDSSGYMATSKDLEFGLKADASGVVKYNNQPITQNWSQPEENEATEELEDNTDNDNENENNSDSITSNRTPGGSLGLSGNNTSSLSSLTTQHIYKQKEIQSGATFKWEGPDAEGRWWLRDTESGTTAWPADTWALIDNRMYYFRGDGYIGTQADGMHTPNIDGETFILDASDDNTLGQLFQNNPHRPLEVKVSDDGTTLKWDPNIDSIENALHNRGVNVLNTDMVKSLITTSPTGTIEFNKGKLSCYWDGNNILYIGSTKMQVTNNFVKKEGNTVLISKELAECLEGCSMRVVPDDIRSASNFKKYTYSKKAISMDGNVITHYFTSNTKIFPFIPICDETINITFNNNKTALFLDKEIESENTKLREDFSTTKSIFEGVYTNCKIDDVTKININNKALREINLDSAILKDSDKIIYGVDDIKSLSELRDGGIKRIKAYPIGNGYWIADKKGDSTKDSFILSTISITNRKINDDTRRLKATSVVINTLRGGLITLLQVILPAILIIWALMLYLLAAFWGNPFSRKLSEYFDLYTILTFGKYNYSTFRGFNVIIFATLSLLIGSLIIGAGSNLMEQVIDVLKIFRR